MLQNLFSYKMKGDVGPFFFGWLAFTMSKRKHIIQKWCKLMMAFFAAEDDMIFMSGFKEGKYPSESMIDCRLQCHHII